MPDWTQNTSTQAEVKCSFSTLSGRRCPGRLYRCETEERREQRLRLCLAAGSEPRVTRCVGLGVDMTRVDTS